MKRILILSLLLTALVSCQRTLPALHERVTIQGSVGSLVGDVDRPEVSGRKCPVAIILHGLTGQRNEEHLQAVADSLHARGIATVRFDFNGHGESEGDFVNMTLDNEFDDAVAMYEYTASLPWADRKRISLVGHSQGGLEAGIVAGALGKDKIRSLVLLAPAACIHTMAVSGNMFGFRIDQDPLPEYVEFWRGTHLGKAYFRSAIDMDVFGRTSAYDGPVLILQGLADTPALIEDAEKYTEYLKDVRYVQLEGLSHCYPEDLDTPARMAADFIAR